MNHHNAAINHYVASIGCHRPHHRSSFLGLDCYKLTPKALGSFLLDYSSIRGLFSDFNLSVFVNISQKTHLKKKYHYNRHYLPQQKAPHNSQYLLLLYLLLIVATKIPRLNFFSFPTTFSTMLVPQQLPLGSTMMAMSKCLSS